MSTATTTGLRGTLAQRRPDAVVTSSTQSSAFVQRSRERTDRLRSRVRFSVSRTFVYRVVVGIIAVVSILGALAVVGGSLSDLGSGAFYRSSLLSVHGFLAMMLLSAVVDQELFDLRTSLIFGVLAFALDLFLTVVELIRHFSCPSGVTQLDIAICLNSPTLSNILPWVALALTVLSLTSVILVGLWQSRRVAELRAVARLALLNAVQNGSIYRETMDAQIESERSALYTRRQRRIARELTTGAGIFRAIVAVLLLVTVLFIVVLNTVYFRAGAFYRGALLIVPAHLAGCMFAFFGKTPNWWRWLTLVFGLLSLASALTGASVEWPRYIKCSNGPPFTTQIEEDICTQDGFLGAVWPIVSLVVGLLSILAVVSVVMSTTRASRAGATAAT